MGAVRRSLLRCVRPAEGTTTAVARRWSAPNRTRSRAANRSAWTDGAGSRPSQRSPTIASQVAPGRPACGAGTAERRTRSSIRSAAERGNAELMQGIQRKRGVGFGLLPLLARDVLVGRIANKDAENPRMFHIFWPDPRKKTLLRGAEPLKRRESRPFEGGYSPGLRFLPIFSRLSCAFCFNKLQA